MIASGPPQEPFDNPVREAFTCSFLRQSLDQARAKCDRYELAPVFRLLLPGREPVLEAGCGSGRWVAWLTRLGVEAVGLDWSAALCERLRRELPGVRVVPGDLRSMPFGDDEFGAALALGSVEHVAEGPERCLGELRRVLRPGGIAVVTVPYAGRFRSAMRTLRWSARLPDRVRMSPTARRILGRPWLGRTSLAEARRGTCRAWRPRFSASSTGWSFFEYEFDRKQMRAFVIGAGFLIVQEFVAFGDEGVFHSLGRLGGRWLEDEERVEFTPLGRFTRHCLPVDMVGHMLCYVLQVPSEEDA